LFNATRYFQPAVEKAKEVLVLAAHFFKMWARTV